MGELRYSAVIVWLLRVFFGAASFSAEEISIRLSAEMFPETAQRMAWPCMKLASSPKYVNMTDIKCVPNRQQETTPLMTTSTRPPLPAENLIELLFFAYRDFIADPDSILEELGFGRAHHRVLHFVDRKPGLTVAELLDLLKITKQSLARVLKQLVDDGHIRQAPGPVDRRRRELYLTATGRSLIQRLREPQSRRIVAALEQSGCGEEDVAGFLSAMVTQDGRRQIELLNESPPQGPMAGQPDEARKYE